MLECRGRTSHSNYYSRVHVMFTKRSMSLQLFKNHALLPGYIGSASILGKNMQN